VNVDEAEEDHGKSHNQEAVDQYMPHDRKDLLALEFAGLVLDVDNRSAVGADNALRELTDSAARALPGSTCAGITVVNRAGEVSTLSATQPDAEKIDDIQRRTQQGPCLDAAWEQHMVHIDDMSVESRWPDFTRDALSTTTIRSIMSFQLFKNRDQMGALNFYSDRPQIFDADAVETGLIAATHTALAWNLVARGEQFRSALASRDMIGQAKGMLMERFGIDAVAAFTLLTRLSQDSNTPLASIAERLTHTPRDTP